ncbi:zinc-ribbon domain-containing protein [uncultured Clostridium sp.]|uniref:zinc ribbon domain-containing protein n=1 Tax=uncultured Clostridium sp. TaxID=59620 RepID=UPI0028EA9A81|nr:zinc-ribbon domain-containing protein [uncultured Clostridium sp.]
MYCQKCGNKVKDEAKFCDKCGFGVENKSELNNEQEELTNNKINNAIYDFAKVKQLGALNMFTIKSKTYIDDERLLINSRKDYLGFIKGKNKEESVRLEDIRYAVNKKNMDFIDGIYAIIFTILSVVFVNPVFLIIALICLWTGYGEQVFVYTKKNQKLVIYTSGGELTKDFIDLINLKIV